MDMIIVAQFMLVVRHTINNDVHSLPKTMSLVKCGHSCYTDITCVSFFYEPNSQKCYPSSSNIQARDNHTTGAFRYYRRQSMAEECYKKCHRYTSLGDLCYRQSSTDKSWEDAQRDCEILGGTLFNIDSPAKHEFFAKVVRKQTRGGKIFIGASRANESSEWTWTDGKKIEQSYWLPKEPDLLIVSQNCVQYKQRDKRYLWDSTVCSFSKRYYCHYPR